MSHSWKVLPVYHYQVALRRLCLLNLAAFFAAFTLAAVCCRDTMAATGITLQEAISRALRVAPTLDSAAAQSDLNMARVAEARAPLLPSILGNSEYYQPSGYSKTISNGGSLRRSWHLPIRPLTAADAWPSSGRRVTRLRRQLWASKQRKHRWFSTRQSPILICCAKGKPKSN